MEKNCSVELTFRDACIEITNIKMERTSINKLNNFGFA